MRYGAGPEQVADLRVPEGAGPHPVAVVLHGGFWLERHTRDLMDGPAADLAARGWASWNVEYRRLGASGGGWPATFADVAAAVDHLAHLDAALDLTRVLAVGHSAGGHLAAWLGGRHRLPDGVPGAGPRVRLAGLVAIAGVLDLEAALEAQVGGRVIDRLLGEAAAEGMALASPAALLPLGVPVRLVHGDADDIVPLWLSQRFAEAAARAGDDASLTVVPGEDHFAPLRPASRTWQATAELLAQLRP